MHLCQLWHPRKQLGAATNRLSPCLPEGTHSFQGGGDVEVAGAGVEQAISGASAKVHVHKDMDFFTSDMFDPYDCLDSRMFVVT